MATTGRRGGQHDALWDLRRGVQRGHRADSEIHLPFGGVKDTGHGHRESGTVAIEQFTEVKTIFLDYSGHLQRAHIDEPTD